MELMENSTLRRRINRLQLKITSQSGASITYALLLFLVCATVSSVILAAGTAAAGRMSQSVDGDQRYYAVTSAARLLKDVYEEYEIRIEKKTITLSKGTARQPEPVIKKRKKGTSVWSNYTTSDKIITALTALLYCEVPSDKEAPLDKTLQLKVGNVETLTVNVRQIIDPSSGQITLQIWNQSKDDSVGSSSGGTSGSGSSGTGASSGTAAGEEESVGTPGSSFVITMIFSPSVKTGNRTKSTEDSDGVVTTTKTETTDMAWTMVQMR